MPNTASVDYKEQDLTTTAGDLGDVIVGISAKTVRGPVNDPSKVYSSFNKFLKVFGGFSNAVPDVTHLVKRLMERGARVRVSRKGHYTNILNASTLDMVLATAYAGWQVVAGSTPLASSSTLEVNVNAGGYVTIPWAGSHNLTMQALADYLNTTYMGSVIKYAFIPKSTTLGANNFSLEAVGFTSTSITGLLVKTTIGGTPTVYTGAAQTAYVVNSVAGNLIQLHPIAKGADYNNLFIYITPGSNGQVGYFNVYITNNEDSLATESFENQYLLPVDTADKQTGTVQMQKSELATFTFSDMSGFTTTQLDPLAGAFGFTGGTDGSALVQLDYVGGANGVGLKSWDAFDDLTAISDIDRTAADTTVVQAGAAYAENRKDLVYLVQLQDLPGENDIAAQRDATGIDSSYVGFYAGALNTKHPITNADVSIPCLGDILGLIAFNTKKFGPQSSWAGTTHGVLTNTTGVHYNFGSKGSEAALGLLSNHQINTAVASGGKVYLKGNFTAQSTFSILSYMNVRMMLLTLRKQLMPILERYLEEPNVPHTWRKLFGEVKPILKDWEKDDGLYKWEWHGDQEAATLNDLTINDKDDVGQGKYVVELVLWPVPTIQKITLNVILTRNSVSFEEALGQLNP